MTCRYRSMIWHILHVVYCIDQGARGGRLRQEASVVGDAAFLFPGQGKEPGPRGRGRPRRLRPPAGGELGSAICSSPGTCMFIGERKIDGAAPYITAAASPSAAPLCSDIIRSGEQTRDPHTEQVSLAVCQLFASVSERTCFRHATTSWCQRSRLCDMCCREHGEIRVRWEREAGGRMKADAI